MTALLELVPGGKLSIASLTDEAGVPHVCVDFTDCAANVDYRLHFELSDFVTIADHLQSVADELVREMASR